MDNDDGTVTHIGWVFGKKTDFLHNTWVTPVRETSSEEGEETYVPIVIKKEAKAVERNIVKKRISYSPYSSPNRKK